jgi:hypothetical protein
MAYKTTLCHVPYNLPRLYIIELLCVRIIITNISADPTQSIFTHANPVAINIIMYAVAGPPMVCNRHRPIGSNFVVVVTACSEASFIR